MKPPPLSGCARCGVPKAEHGTSSGSYWPEYADAPRHTYEAPDEATKQARREAR